MIRMLALVAGRAEGWVECWGRGGGRRLSIFLSWEMGWSIRPIEKFGSDPRQGYVVTAGFSL